MLLSCRCCSQDLGLHTRAHFVAFRCRLAATVAEKRLTGRSFWCIAEKPPAGRSFWCIQTCRKATFGSYFLVCSDIIGGRGATGRAAQENDWTPFFGGQILDMFLRGFRWSNGSVLEAKMEPLRHQRPLKNLSKI